MDLSLHTNEFAEVTDIGGTWHRAKAVLDTGAQWTRWLRMSLRGGLMARLSECRLSVPRCQAFQLVTQSFCVATQRHAPSLCMPVAASLLTRSWPCVAPGNGGCTLITFRMAHLLGIVDGAGLPVGVSRPRYVSVRVVVVACGIPTTCCLAL